MSVITKREGTVAEALRLLAHVRDAAPNHVSMSEVEKVNPITVDFLFRNKFLRARGPECLITPEGMAYLGDTSGRDIYAATALLRRE